MIMSYLTKDYGKIRMWVLYFVVWCWCCKLASGSNTSPDSKYEEHLHIRPLPENALQLSFDFLSYSEFVPEDLFFADKSSKNRTTDYDHYNMFPRSLGQIIDHTHVNELHLRFAQGWWNAEKWGQLPHSGVYAGGTGVEMWAGIKSRDTSVDEIYARWKSLANMLSGLFCASLNFLDAVQTAHPEKAFKPLDYPTANETYFLRGTLPREPVCTENLTPFLKFLPCKGKSGVSSLLDGHKLFDSLWQSMSIDVVPECDKETGMCRFKMVQVIVAVIDVDGSFVRQSSGVAKPIPFDELQCDQSRPYAQDYVCFPIVQNQKAEWKLSQIFGRNIQGSCPLASNNVHISVEAGPNWSIKLLEELSNPIHGADFELKSDTEYDLELDSDTSLTVIEPDTPKVRVDRKFTGSGQQTGGLRAVFQNPSDKDTVTFVYLETLPWYIRVYLHTLDVEIKSLTAIDSESAVPVDESPYSRDSVIKDIIFKPAVDRVKNSQLEIEIELPPSTWVSLEYEFDKSLLFLEEYPPDANHGFHISPAVLVGVAPTEFYIRTTSLLLSLPTPDFSMPYNVIILTCTVMALAFGTIFNLLMKRVMKEEDAELLTAGSPVTKLKSRLKVVVDRVRGKFSPIFEKPDKRPFPVSKN